MTFGADFESFLTRSSARASTIYVIALAGLFGVAYLASVDAWEGYRGLVQTDHLMRQMGGQAVGGSGESGAAPERAGSPFLEGPTVTVAGAALLQRVGRAVAKVGGSIQSSQVDLTGATSNDRRVALMVSCELDQPALQALLYDLESGMPFLFVDQLDVQMPNAGSEAIDERRLRVFLSISGLWRAESQ